MAYSQEDDGPPERALADDFLAAVVLHVLVAHPSTLTLEHIAVACERDPELPADRSSLELALRGLVEDGLAYRRGARFGPTRAALRAFELSF